MIRVSSVVQHGETRGPNGPCVSPLSYLPELRALWMAMAFVASSVCVGPNMGAARAESAIDSNAALALSRGAVGHELADYRLTRTNGTVIRTAMFRGKPLIVSLIYTSCPDVCPLVSESLRDAAESARSLFGRDAYHVLTVGFDARHDTPDRMNGFARTHGLGGPNWDVVSADFETIRGIASDLGFSFQASARGFDHVTQTTIVGSDGRVVRQIYGANFDPPHLIEPLKEIILNQPASDSGISNSVDNLLKRIQFVCTFYDPALGRYRFDYSLIIAIGVGSITLGLVAWVVVRGWAGLRRTGSV